MTLASEALFDGEPCAAAVAYYEHLRQRRIERQRIRQRADAEWLAMPDEINARDHARQHLAAMTPERRAMLEAEWAAREAVEEYRGIE